MADIHITTTMGHYAQGNGTIDVFRRFYNLCLRLLPSFATRISFAFNTAPRYGTGQVSTFQVQHSRGPARAPFPDFKDKKEPIDEEMELALPALYAESVTVFTKIFCQIAQKHDEFVRRETALRLN
jgi:hypothetical protein